MAGYIISKFAAPCRLESNLFVNGKTKLISKLQLYDSSYYQVVNVSRIWKLNPAKWYLGYLIKSFV